MAATTATAIPTPDQVREALKHWYSTDSQGTLTMLYQFRQLERELGRNSRHVTNQLLLAAMESLQAKDPQAHHFLLARFLDKRSISQLANQFSVAESTIYALQSKAIEQVAGILEERESQVRVAQYHRLQERLEAPTYLQLVGVEEYVSHLFHLLEAPQAPWLFALEGLGGLGKTALADTLLRQFIERGAYDEVAWVSARQAYFNLGGAIRAVAEPALTSEALIEALVRQLMPELVHPTVHQAREVQSKLRARLKQLPHLIVIDNLETLLDVESLLPLLQDLANPSKFLLTSRVGLYNAPNIHHFKIPELSAANAYQLIRQEAKVSNLPALAAATDAELQPIYATAGGNPLALRLIVGQTHIYTLSSILAHLQAARGQAAEQLYTFIYWHAWQSLDSQSQDVLLIMPLVNPQGDEAEVIADVGEFPLDDVRKALNQLVTLNLIDTRGTFHDRRYTIHGLTRTFLHEQILRRQP
ncbi:MAG: hypothetical protein KF832_07055 [Caldilineaceae bacterium]|nr:hypothetical protein [Caldilineaceae bacterium]